MTEARGPLAGVRIVDMTAMLAGPWATMILGDQGADVIKIEAPGAGDHTRASDGDTPSPGFLNLNRSKRSVALDLKTPRGRELLLALAETADVAVQNFRPGVVDRLGVGYDAVRAARPDIVYVSISGFGTEGPYAAQRVYDPVIQGLSGLTTIQAGSDEVRPRLVRTVLPDKLTAMTAAQAISSALYARAQSGRGQHIRLSMLDAVLQFLWASDMGQQTLPDREPAPQRPASRIDLIYRTRDGHITLGANTDKEWAGLARALGKPELIHDPRFATPAARQRNIDARLALVQEHLLDGSSAHWLETLRANEVPCAPTLTRNEVIAHPQIAASNSLIEYDHPLAGRLRQTRSAALFEGTPLTVPRGAPALGADTDSVLAEIGVSSAEIAELRAAGVIGGVEMPRVAAE